MTISTIRRSAAVLATAAALAGAASPVAAATPNAANALRAQCLADDGVYAIGRGFIRCQGARTDGMGVFWAEAQVCERAYGTYFKTNADPAAPQEIGAWVCSIS